ncbi:Class I glutamine amidotransferase-like protein [Sarocladium implicatum]|nr:Class I glutamine amidotransferase-like protein [Sarocladium implicatum]
MATPQPRTFRIANLNCDTPVPNVRPTFETYGRMFHPLLAAAAERTAPHITIESTEFDVVLGHYPETLDDFDALLITGSAASSYDDAEWIRKLGQYIRAVYQSNPRVRMFGSCFGHQIISDYLLDGFGAKCEKDPAGWEIGVHEVKLSEEFRRIFDSKALEAKALERPPTPDDSTGKEVPSSLKLQFVHADHVRIEEPEKLPSDWINVGTSQHCAVQGICQPGRVLTLQGHFEFDRFVNSEVLKVFGASWEEGARDKALRQIDADDDSAVAAELVLQFFVSHFVSQERSVGGQPQTPPVTV